MNEDQQEIQRLKNEIETLKKKQGQQLNEIEEDVAEIKNGLFGNDRMKTKGLAQKVEEHEQYIEQDKKLKNKVGGIMALLSFILTAFGFFINNLLTKLFK